MEKHEVKIRPVTTKYKHTHTAFVEALNKVLTEQLFKVQDAQELNYSEEVSFTWVKHRYGLLDQLNNMKTRMIGMSPTDAIELKEVPLVNRENYPSEVSHVPKPAKEQASRTFKTAKDKIVELYKRVKGKESEEPIAPAGRHTGGVSEAQTVEPETTINQIKTRPA